MSVESDISRRALLLGSAGKPQGLKVLENCLAQRSIACRICEDACDPQAIRFRLQLGGKSIPSIDEDACTLCGECVLVCPVNALVASGEGHG
ncbi:MAG: 4Fe-4S dicluster domain-containing protein [Hyphomicrobiales bacterium]